MKHLLAKIEQLQEEKAAMIRQLNDQDLRMEKQHREWSNRIVQLQEEIAKLRRKHAGYPHN